MHPVSTPGELLWRPSTERARASRMADYMRWLNESRKRHGRPELHDYAELWQFSVDRIEEFWRSLWDYFDLGPLKFNQVLERRAMPGARWFPGVELNYVARLLQQPREQPAIVYQTESGSRAELSMGELLDAVARCRAALKALGVARGDRVVAYVTNRPETVVAFLATASLGAIWSSCPPEFGAESVLDRFRQIEPKVMFASAGYDYGGKRFDRRAEVSRLRQELGSLRACIWVGDVAELGENELSFDRLPVVTEPLEVELVPFDHPLWILFSSGTTGLPKPIVHGHGGMLLEHLKALALHADLGQGDRFFWFTTTGWMMWNYLVSGLQVGATIVLYDGNPSYPDKSRLWRLAADERITYFGVSAAFLLACRAEGIVPREEFDLSRLRGIGSTGAPLPSAGFDWVYGAVSPDVWLGSISGGTDLCTAFVGSCPLLPVYSAELQCLCLGAHVQAVDARGEPVIGEVGELVIRSPMPCMPLGFWNDPGQTRYLDSYFSMFPGVWRHGDWILVTPRGSAIITGRSDATLNRGGVRMGTSEFYRVIEDIPQIVDSVVVDTSEASGGGKLWLFVVLREGHELDAALIAIVRQNIRLKLSPRHVPDELRGVPAIPRTLNGKKLEVPIKRLLGGAELDDVVNPGTLQNPGAVIALLDAARRATPAARENC
jgi:acetoacetyl-CoA synthetase